MAANATMTDQPTTILQVTSCGMNIKQLKRTKKQLEIKFTWPTKEPLQDRPKQP